LGSQVGGVVETGIWTADKQPVALLAKKMIGWIVQVIPQQAIEVIPVLSTRKIVIRQKLGWHFLLRR
jgi:hypothetical protein